MHKYFSDCCIIATMVTTRFANSSGKNRDLQNKIAKILKHPQGISKMYVPQTFVRKLCSMCVNTEMHAIRT